MGSSIRLPVKIPFTNKKGIRVKRYARKNLLKYVDLKTNNINNNNEAANGKVTSG
jgi:hypothetical protein